MIQLLQAACPRPHRTCLLLVVHAHSSEDSVSLPVRVLVSITHLGKVSMAWEGGAISVLPDSAVSFLHGPEGGLLDRHVRNRELPTMGQGWSTPSLGNFCLQLELNLHL